MEMLGKLLARFMLSPRERWLYLVVCITLGVIMNAAGHALQIASFKYWWQVGTCYVGFVFPVAVLIRDLHWLRQITWGLIAMVPLELVGYAIGTSVPYPNNVVERALGVHNFVLVMVIIAAPLPFVVNSIVGRARMILGEKISVP
jgi:hypothetical protein